ncbi:hypothetical protein H9Q09_21085 [Aurantimonas sp. DM33-3]|uniref:hypothetical protein n=1 Tax=Aurantimonas sp. DM33-3 TaxID=2766955 RepID=UPI001651D64E|nr:hypothetical protein [Aurantimonas sp. DM33-3]MBC6718681.1 hypothetical protein [Aurantimonas sp. DM33-3]
MVNTRTKPTKGNTRPPGFETKGDAAAARDSLVRLLASADGNDAQALARKLLGCRKEDRCGSNGCPVCNRRLRLRLDRQMKRSLRGRAFEVAAITLIPADFRVEVGELSAFNLVRWVASRKRALERALPPEALFIGGVDISLNTFENRDPHWCIHIHGFVIAPMGWGLHNRAKLRRLRAEIDRRCRPIQAADRVARERPLRVGTRNIHDFHDKLLYGHKSGFYCRSRYVEVKRKSGKRSTNAFAQRLPNSTRVELAIFLDHYPLGSRVILIGMRRRGRFDRFALTLQRDLPVVTKRGALGSESAESPC